MLKIPTVIALAVLATGCANNRIHSWGGYDDLLYAGYKSPDQMEVARTKLEAHVLTLKGSGQRVPPGIYAELGTLYLQSGNKPKALGYYQLEHDTWPESRYFMSAMVANLSKDIAEKKGDQK